MSAADINESNLVTQVRASLMHKFGTQSAYARHCRISPAFLSDCLTGKRNLPLYMLTDAGIKRVVTYEWMPA